MQNQYDSGTNPNMSRLRKNTKKMRRRASQRRSRTLLFLIAAVVLVVVFLTPVFDIRSVKIEGTDKVTSEQTDPIIRTAVGQNLFTVGLKSFKESFCAIPYVKNTSIKRRLYPPSLTVTVTECTPVAYAATAGGFVIMDDECKILEIALQPPSEIPQITGISLKNPVAGKKIEVDSSGAANAGTKSKNISSKDTPSPVNTDTSKKTTVDETNKSDIIVLCIKTLGHMSSKIKNIDITDTENISFDYENRLRVLCGSSIDFEEKIRLFEEAVNSNRLASNARGTMDLSITGKAVYTP